MSAAGMNVIETLTTPEWSRVIAREADGTYTATVTFWSGKTVTLSGYHRIETARYDAYAATRKPDGRSSRQRNHGYVV